MPLGLWPRGILSLLGTLYPIEHSRSLSNPYFAVSAPYTKVKNAFKSFKAIRIKIPFVENYKECTILAILWENTLLCLGTTQAKTFCAMLLKGPKKYKSVFWIRKKSLLRRKSAILSVRKKFHCIAKIILALCL